VKADAVFFFERNDIVLGEPHGDLDCDRSRIVGKHKALELGMALVIAADCGQNECRHVGRNILFSDDDELIEREKIRRKLRAPGYHPRFGINRAGTIAK
jgi:hypothetical protein